MAKKTIGIHSGFLYYPPEYMHTWDETNLEKGGIGGSEIWALKMADEFQKHGYQVVFFCDCDYMHFADNGVMFVNPEDFDELLKGLHFDCFISSRDVYFLENTNINADKLFLMFHDTLIPIRTDCYDDDWMMLNDMYNKNMVDKIDKIFYQSDFQKERLIKNYHFDESIMVRTHQSIDVEKYSDVDVTKKKNRMVWSTHKNRGAKILIEKILPRIRERVPDFEIDVCGYVNDTVDDYFNNEGVVVHGNVPKDELIRLQKEASIWIYPNTGVNEDGELNDETFCITAIENGCAKNALVLANKTCFRSTLKGYINFVGDEFFSNGSEVLTKESADFFCNRLADEACELLLNKEKAIKCGESAYEISSKYTWENAYKTFADNL